MDILLIGDRKDLVKYQEAFEEKGKSVGIFDAQIMSAEEGVRKIKEAREAIVTFGINGALLIRSVVEEIARAKQSGIASVFVAEPYQFVNGEAMAETITAKIINS